MPTDTRERILQAAFDVLSRDGYENTSIKQIAEQAGVAQGLVHYYFKSKQGLVMAVLQFVCQKLELDVQGEAGALAAFEDTKHKIHDDRGSNALYVQLIGIGLIAGAVWGAVLGIIIQSLVEPEFNADEAIDALAAMSLSAVYPANQSA